MARPRRKMLPPIHPGEVLAMEFLEPLGLTQYRLAKSLKVPARRINKIVHGTRAISADTALRLARFFGTADRFWLNLQAAYDLEVERIASDHALSAMCRSSRKEGENVRVVALASECVKSRSGCSAFAGIGCTPSEAEASTGRWVTTSSVDPR